MSVKQSQQQQILDDLFARLKNQQVSSSVSTTNNASSTPTSSMNLNLIFSCASQNEKCEFSTKSYINQLINNLVQTSEKACQEFEVTVEKDELEKLEQEQEERIQKAKRRQEQNQELSAISKKRQEQLEKLLQKPGNNKNSSKSKKLLPTRPSFLTNSSLPLHHSQLFFEGASNDNNNYSNTSSSENNGFFEYRCLNLILPLSEKYEEMKHKELLRKKKDEEETNVNDDNDNDEDEDEQQEKESFVSHFTDFFTIVSVDIYFTLLPELVKNVIIKQNQQIQKKRASYKDSKSFLSLTCLFNCFDLECNISPLQQIFIQQRNETKQAMAEILTKDEQMQQNDNEDDDQENASSLLKDSFSRIFEHRLAPLLPKDDNNTTRKKVYDENSKQIQLRNDESNFFPSFLSTPSSTSKLDAKILEGKRGKDIFTNFVIGISATSSPLASLSEQLLRRLAMESGSSYISYSSPSSSQEEVSRYVLLLSGLVYLLRSEIRINSLKKQRADDEEENQQQEQEEANETFKSFLSTFLTSTSNSSSGNFFPHFTDGIGLLENPSARGTNLQNFIEGDLKSAETKFVEEKEQKLVKKKQQQFEETDSLIADSHLDLLSQIEKKLAILNKNTTTIQHQDPVSTQMQQQPTAAATQQQQGSEENLWDEF